eukprot:gene55185-35479_t
MVSTLFAAPADAACGSCRRDAGGVVLSAPSGVAVAVPDPVPPGDGSRSPANRVPGLRVAVSVADPRVFPPPPGGAAVIGGVVYVQRHHGADRGGWNAAAEHAAMEVRVPVPAPDPSDPWPCAFTARSFDDARGSGGGAGGWCARLPAPDAPPSGGDRPPYVAVGLTWSNMTGPAPVAVFHGGAAAPQAAAGTDSDMDRRSAVESAEGWSSDG